MHLYLVRHAIAVARSEPRLDHARPLTAEGRTRFEAEVRGLDRMRVRFTALLHSPWTRAVQTADLLEPLLDGPRSVCDGLACAPDDGLLDTLRTLDPDAATALVGHQPWLGELAAWLLFGDPALGDALVLKKGGVLEVRGEPRPAGCGLVAHLPPRALRRCASRLK